MALLLARGIARRGLWLAAIALAWTATPTPAPAAATAGWSPVPGAMAAARSSFGAAMLNDGRVLLVGGNGQRSADLYDPRTNTISPTGSLAAGRSDHTATVLGDGRVLVVGGVGACTSGVGGGPRLTSAEIYDPATGAFSPTGSLTTGRQRHSATLLRNGKVLVAGGVTQPAASDGILTLSSAELYDPATGQFSPVGDMVTRRSRPVAVLLGSGKVLLATTGETSLAADLYDPDTGSFTATGPETAGRGDATGTLLRDGRVLIAGGANCPGGVCSNIAAVEIYDPATEQFTVGAQMTTPRSRQIAAMLPDGKVLLAGGCLASGGSSCPQGTSSAELYDPAAGAFSPAPAMGTARRNHAAAELRSGNVLVAGGRNVADGAPGGCCTTAEVYDPGLRRLFVPVVLRAVEPS